MGWQARANKSAEKRNQSLKVDAERAVEVAKINAEIPVRQKFSRSQLGLGSIGYYSLK